MSLDNVLIVTVLAFSAPFALGLVPALRLPSVVVEIVAGIVVGPSVLGWVEVDPALGVLSLVGLAFLLFLSGLEIDFAGLRGQVLRLAGGGWVLSFGLALAVCASLGWAGAVDAPVFVAVVLAATSLGIVVPVLKDAGAAATPFGQLVIAAGTIADFGCIILLSLLFTGEGGPTSTAILLASLFAVAAAVLVAVRQAERSRRVMGTLARLQDTTAQIRVRGAMILLVGFVVLAESFGLEAILGAFAAGAVLTLVDRDEAMTHPEFRHKLEAMGFGFFIPLFFVTSGVRFDLGALLDRPATLALVPVFLAALLVIRGAPAMLYRGALTAREVGAAALLQSTSLPFIVAATAIGQDLGLVDGAQAAALVAAGLLSVLVFPATALAALTPRGRPVSA